MPRQPIGAGILRIPHRGDAPLNRGELDNEGGGGVPPRARRAPEVDPEEESLDRSEARQELLVNELYNEVHYLQRVLNRVPDVFGRQPSGANQIYDPDQTVIQLRFAGPALSPIELAQSMARNIAEIKGIMAGRSRIYIDNLAEEQERIYVRLGQKKFTERLSFFSTLVTAQAAILFGFLIAWLTVGLTDGGMHSLAAIDLVLVGPAHAALTPMVGSEAAIPAEAIIRTSILIGSAVLCMFAYALSIHVMFISRRPTRSQVDLAKFYSGFFTGLLTHLLRVL